MLKNLENIFIWIMGGVFALAAFIASSHACASDLRFVCRDSSLTRTPPSKVLPYQVELPLDFLRCDME